MRARRLCIILTAIFGAGPCLAGGSLLERIRSIDMNDYSLGVAVATRQSPFTGGENGTVAYPYLTSFTHSSMTDAQLE